MRFFTFLVLILFSFLTVNAQVCSNPGMTPQTGIAVCGVLTFPQANVPSCSGPDLPVGACGSDPVTSSNSMWYRFHCYQTGSLGFLISPASGSDDYDWQLMDITGHQPQDVLTTNLGISLNLSGITGATGCTPTGTLDVHCSGGAAGSQFNQMPTIVAGKDYLLMVTNWSNSGLGYNLIFTGGTAILTNNQPPAITNVAIVGCNTSLLKVTFSEDVLCSSLTSAGSEFTITNGTHVITGVTSACTNGNNALNQLTIALQSPIPPGNYQLVVNNGTDLNTLIDVCQEAMPAATSFPFTVPALNPLAINSISYSGCAPTILKVALSNPVLCSTITGTGSEFTLAGNMITSVISNCTTGALYTDTIQVVLQNPLTFGNYQLIVNNGSDGNTFTDTCGASLLTGYNFPFVINQTTTAPAIQSVVFDECKPFKIVLNFDKSIACNSLTANGSEFSITPGILTVTGISSSCISNGTTSQIILTLSGNLPAGNFNLNINNGSDGNTVSDSCAVFVPVNIIKPFTTTQAPTPVYDSLQYNKCSPSVIKVFYSKPINCNSVNANGSEFLITGPTAVTITAVTTDVTCSNGFTNWVLLQLSQPINVFGNYILHNAAGADGDSVSDTCFASQNTSETISFNVLGSPSAIFTDQVKFGCVKDTIVVTHPGGNGINSWIWNFSDGTSATGQTTSHTFPVSTVTATIQLIVSNGLCSDTLLRSFTLDNAFNADFTQSADTICRNIALNFTNNSTGNNLQFQWQFGDNTQFIGQTAPAHSYAVSNLYTVHLIATNNHGCVDTATKQVFVTPIPVISFTGLNTKYCTAETVLLTAQLQGNISNYTWNNGNAVTAQNQTNFSFSYASQGSYNISLDAMDKFCGTITSSASTQVYKVPVFSLGEDQIFCPGITVPLGVQSTSGYTYLWNTGAASAQIISGPTSYTYQLAINNNGCLGQDEVFIKVLDNCLIKVPGAFTPNGDGVNDKLKAINAELATNFLLRVYNRFGQLIFSTSNPVMGWDGTFKGVDSASGTYVWQLSYVHPVTKLPVYEKGTSILIR
jgi:gliding motility-associated-like protein